MSLVISPKAYNSKVGLGLFCPVIGPASGSSLMHPRASARE